MATLQIAFCDLGSSQNGCSIPVSDGTTLVSESISLTSSNQQSSAATKPFARLVTDTACYVAFGADPDSATTTSRVYLPANSPDYFYVGKGNKVGAKT